MKCCEGSVAAALGCVLQRIGNCLDHRSVLCSVDHNGRAVSKTVLRVVLALVGRTVLVQIELCYLLACGVVNCVLCVLRACELGCCSSRCFGRSLGSRFCRCLCSCCCCCCGSSHRCLGAAGCDACAKNDRRDHCRISFLFHIVSPPVM